MKKWQTNKQTNWWVHFLFRHSYPNEWRKKGLGKQKELKNQVVREDTCPRMPGQT